MNDYQIRAEWRPCANNGRGGYGYFKNGKPIKPPKSLKLRRRLTYEACRRALNVVA